MYTNLNKTATKVTTKVIILCTFVVAVFLIAAGCASATDEMVKVGKDEIPTVYSAVGEKAITGTSVSTTNGVHTKEITYADGALMAEEMQAYVDALLSQGFIYTADSEVSGSTVMLQLGAQSVEEGKIVVIDIWHDMDAGGAAITYTVGEGTLTLY